MKVITAPLRVGRKSLLIIFLLLAVTLVAGVIDDRTLNGGSVWSKPIKFNVSFAVHVATLIVFLYLLRSDVLVSPLIKLTMLVTCAAVLLELLYVSFQAARGRASHFNLETPWEEMAYYAMGAGVALVMCGTLIIGIAVWARASPEVGPALQLGVALGATLGTLATLATAGAMSSMQFTPTGHWVGGELSDANGLPIVGWSTTGGDLRVPHFFATHLIQTLPVVGWLADRSGIPYPRLIVGTVSFLALGLVWFTFHQALTGEPFLSDVLAQ